MPRNKIWTQTTFLAVFYPRIGICYRAYVTPPNVFFFLTFLSEGGISRVMNAHTHSNDIIDSPELKTNFLKYTICSQLISRLILFSQSYLLAFCIFESLLATVQRTS